MKTIVCATRGGEASRRTQEKAIEIAKEKEAKLIFLFVIDPAMVKKVSPDISKEFLEELAFLARLHLRVACFLARKKKVESDFVIGEDTIHSAIAACLKEYEADLFIIGKPKEAHSQKHFDELEQVKKFADAITESTGVEVKIV